MATKEKLRAYFKDVGADVKDFAFDTIDEYVFFSEQLQKLKKLPLIRIDTKNPEKQQLTPAAKLIKDYSQVIDAKRGTLLRILNRIEGSAADDLLDMLKEFESGN